MAAKQHFRQSQRSSCVYCGIWIKCDMYRHVARFHLDLAQFVAVPSVVVHRVEGHAPILHGSHSRGA